MDWFLYDTDLRQKELNELTTTAKEKHLLVISWPVSSSSTDYLHDWKVTKGWATYRFSYAMRH